MEYKSITLVTGAAGFMGSHMVERLAGSGIKLRATARARSDTSFFDRLGVEFMAADLTQPETLPRLFDGGVDRVFHFGAICNFSTPYRKLYPTNVLGVERFTKLALDCRVKCFVHVTSTSVYGQYRGFPFREQDPREPKDDYGKSKKEGEDVVLQRIQEGLPAMIVRPCTVYGPRCTDGAGKAFSRPTSIQAIPGNGKQRLSNVRAEDVAAAMLHLSLQERSVGQVYNVSDDSHPTVKEALTLAALAFGSKPPRLHLPLGIVRGVARFEAIRSSFTGKIPDLEVDAVQYLYNDYVVDNSKLKQTGYRLIYPDFKESMQQMGEWYRKEVACKP